MPKRKSKEVEELEKRIASLERQITKQLEREAKTVAELEDMNCMQARARYAAYATLDTLAARDIDRSLELGDFNVVQESGWYEGVWRVLARHWVFWGGMSRNRVNRLVDK